MKWNLLALGVVLVLLAGCAIVEPCGTFEFNGTAVDTSSENGVNMSVSYDFAPGDCESTCTCDPVVYVQIVRTVDWQTFAYLYPSTEKQNRATNEGWYIDRIANRVWGYYGRNDDGSFASYLTPGSDVNLATLQDSPRRPESEPWLGIWWQAVSVPVCIEEGSACENNLLGYYFWSWFVEDTGVVAGVWDWIAGPTLADAVDDAVAEWNPQALALGKNAFPAFTRLAP